MPRDAADSTVIQGSRDSASDRDEERSVALRQRDRRRSVAPARAFTSSLRQDDSSDFVGD